MPDGTGGGTPPSWSFQFKRDIIYITPKEFEVEIYDTVSFATSPTDLALAVSPASCVVTEKTVKFSDANNYNVSITKDGTTDTAIIKVKPKIIDFAVKNDQTIWPNASGDSISKDDFNINFEPTDATWIHSASSGSPELQPGEIRTYIAKAIVSKNGNSAEKECSYTIMGPGEWWESLPLPTTVSESFSNVDVSTTTTLQAAFGIIVYERRNGTISGTGNFIEKDFAGWTVKGGSLESSTESGYEISANIGATWKAASSQISFAYSTTNSVSFGHGGINSFRIAMKGYKQNLPTTTSGQSIKRRQFTTGNPELGTLPSDTGWYDYEGTFTETNTGSGDPAKCLGKKFP